MIDQEVLALVNTLLKQSAGLEQGLNNIQSFVLLGTWAGRSYEEIATQSGYANDYIRQVGSQLWRSLTLAIGEEVSKKNLRVALQRYCQSQNGRGASMSTLTSCKQDWGEAIDVSQFYGRQEELQRLNSWILDARCRVIGIFGLGGMGKTALSVKLAQQIQSQFQSVIWRSLQQTPPLNTLLSEIVPLLAGSEVAGEGSMTALMEQLRQQRCLLVLDNVESILQDGNRSGQYQPGYETYRQLFERISDVPHQSCLIITGREKPGGFAVREGKDLPVRSLHLQGLLGADGQQILIAKGLEATETQRQTLVNYFGGNPLALKIAATAVQELFAGDTRTFLAQGSTVFGDLWDLLEQQFERLSSLQHQIMYWLAINREGVTPAKLEEEIFPQVSRRELLEALASLKGRSLVETAEAGLTQQPVIMEYVTESFIQAIREEITGGKFNLFKTHALIEAQTQDYVRDAQIQLILHPLTERLLAHFATQAQLEQHTCQLLASLRHQTTTQTGYAGGNLVNLLCYLKTDLTGFDFSHLVIRQAYLANAVLHNANFSYTQMSQTVFAETFGGVLSVAFSPDGQRLATSDTKGEIQIWDTHTGNNEYAAEDTNVGTWAIAFSPDGQYLASASDDYLVKLWEVETGQCLQTYQGHTYSVNTVAFNPNLKALMLASSGQDSTIRLWQVSPTKPALEIQSLVGHAGRVWSITFSPDGQTLASGGEDCTIRLWNVATGVCHCVWQAHERWVRAVAFSPIIVGTQSLAPLLASGSYDGTIKLWDTETQHCLKTLSSHRQAITAIAFSPNGKYLVSSSFDRTVKWWDVATGDCLKTFLGHTNRVWSVAYHPNGQQLASGGDDHATKLWNLKTGRCTKTFKGHTNALLSLALSPDGNYLASGHEDQTVKLWDIKSGAIVQTLQEHTNRVWSVTFQPASLHPLLASGSADYTIKLWDWQSGNCLQTLQSHASWVWSIAFHPDGKHLASGSYDQTVKLWDVDTGECLQTLLGHTSPVVSVAFSSNGRLASSEFDGIIKLWDRNTGECRTIKGHTNNVWSVIFSPNNQWLLSASFDQTLKLWSVATGECIQTFIGHQGAVSVARFSPDGLSIVSGSTDGTLKVWDILTGQCQLTLAGHTDLVSTLLLSRVHQEDGTSGKLTVISGSFDESIKLWDLQAQKCWQTLKAPCPYEGMKIEGIQGLTEAQWATLKALGANSLCSTSFQELVRSQVGE